MIDEFGAVQWHLNYIKYSHFIALLKYTKK